MQERNDSRPGDEGPDSFPRLGRSFLSQGLNRQEERPVQRFPRSASESAASRRIPRSGLVLRPRPGLDRPVSLLVAASAASSPSSSPFVSPHHKPPEWRRAQATTAHEDRRPSASAAWPQPRRLPHAFARPLARPRRLRAGGAVLQLILLALPLGLLAGGQERGLDRIEFVAVGRPTPGTRPGPPRWYRKSSLASGLASAHSFAASVSRRWVRRPARSASTHWRSCVQPRIRASWATSAAPRLRSLPSVVIRRASRSASFWISFGPPPPARVVGQQFAVRDPPLGVLGPLPRLHQPQEEPAAELLFLGREAAVDLVRPVLERPLDAPQLAL